MARDLAAGGSMHGDIALAEAQGSLEAFFHLVALGVPFPRDRYGAFVGYKTDHDPRQRATSAGPLTSRLMFGRLAAEVRRRGIRVFDRHETVALVVKGKGDGRQVIGAIALNPGSGPSAAASSSSTRRTSSRPRAGPARCTPIRSTPRARPAPTASSSRPAPSPTI
jgi:succinate dehydrogenase/fumarate reductase flavoprotein subunit